MQQESSPTTSRPSSSSGQWAPLAPLGFSLLLSAAANNASFVQGAVGLAAGGLFVAGRELLGLGLFIPATVTRLIPGVGGLLLPSSSSSQPTPHALQPQLLARGKFTHTHGVEPLKAIHHKRGKQQQHHNQQQQPGQQAAGGWHQALPAAVTSAAGNQWSQLVGLAQHHAVAAGGHHNASRVRHQQHRMAQRMQQGKALFRLPPVLPAAASAATIATLEEGGWMISSKVHSGKQQAAATAAAPSCVLSRCGSSLASKAPLPATLASPALLKKGGNSSSRQRSVAARGSYSAAADLSSEEEWLSPVTHMALRSSML